MRPEEQEPVLPPSPRSSIHRYITWADMDLVNSNYECPVEYSGEEGVILSHPTWSAEDYPDSYRSPLAPTPRRRWYLAVEEGHRIQVTWTDFKLEGAASGASCGYDYAAVLDSSGEVREGGPPAQLLAGNTGLLSCGAALPPTVTSRSNRWRGVRRAQARDRDQDRRLRDFPRFPAGVDQGGGARGAGGDGQPLHHGSHHRRPPAAGRRDLLPPAPQQLPQQPGAGVGGGGARGPQHRAGVGGAPPGGVLHVLL